MSSARIQRICTSDGTHAGGNDDVQSFSMSHVKRCKRAFTTRRVPTHAMKTLRYGNVQPRAGDLMLARVERIRQHTRLELTDGRRAHMHPGDEIIVCVGNRYAPDQFHAVVPDTLGPCALAAAGGIAARVLARHSAIKPATEISLVAAVADDDGDVLNVADFALPSTTALGPKPPVVVTLGTSMNSGKTATVSHLVRGMSKAGLRVGVAKVTGTGSGGDLWRAIDAGAEVALDFVDAGYASTYCVPGSTTLQIMQTLIAHLTKAQVDVILIEVADGVLQSETAELIASPRFQRMADEIVFAAADSVGAIAGVEQLRRCGLTARLLSGALTQSPLAMQEASLALDIAVTPVKDLADAAFACSLLAGSTPVIDRDCAPAPVAA